jgi:hypothetical protein
MESVLGGLSVTAVAVEVIVDVLLLSIPIPIAIITNKIITTTPFPSLAF